MSMSDERLNAIVSNEKEWRKELFKQVTDTRKELNDFKIDMAVITTTLKVKIGLFGGFFGFISGILGALVMNKLNK